ncbi:hypothetical protein [Flavobacterium sp. N2038]|uniref:hypothetical protein n=1 Tax=Flavobacterium sp. N2038 TaxID=2986829 RepID=UPI002224094D|nr:hypothetical protein [Flavobacterium sp. N2038]
MTISKLKIYLDETVKDSPLFKSKEELSICKPEIFKYGVFAEEIPQNVYEADFDYLQSKIPAYELLYSDFLSVYADRIENISKDDRKKKLISEVIGVAFGIKYTVELLGTNPSKFKKIGALIEGKYMDYSVVVDNKEYELETKGTVSKYYSSFKKDILSKKRNKHNKDVYLRFGTIAMINNEGEANLSKCVIVDDPPNEDNIGQNSDSYKIQLLNYAMFLSYILDPKYYNKYFKPLKANKLNRIRIDNNKFFTKYTFKDKVYYGECFDYRLIRGDLDTLQNNNSTDLFTLKTMEFGKTKFFIGIDERIVDSINANDVFFLDHFDEIAQCIIDGNSFQFLDKDGILIVKSKDSWDRQLDTLFTEEEVKRRLGYSLNYSLGISHKCGAPCTSKDREGKPCEIRTFRKNCHFHR